MQYFILSFIGEDRPGFVHEITSVVSSQGGNWLESRMVQLGGKFAGLARVSVEDSAAAALEQEVAALAQGRFSLLITPAQPKGRPDALHYSIDILGNDRPGILNETTRALAELGINLIEVSSTIEPASMSGAPMFSCKAMIEVGPDQSVTEVDAQLTAIGQKLAVDILIEEQPLQQPSG